MIFNGIFAYLEAFLEEDPLSVHLFIDKWWLCGNQSAVRGLFFLRFRDVKQSLLPIQGWNISSTHSSPLKNLLGTSFLVVFFLLSMGISPSASQAWGDILRTRLMFSMCLASLPPKPCHHSSHSSIEGIVRDLIRELFLPGREQWQVFHQLKWISPSQSLVRLEPQCRSRMAVKARLFYP